jgi:hypothetical protein
MKILRILSFAFLFLFLPSKVSAQGTFIQGCSAINISGGTSCTLTGMGAHHFIISSIITFSAACPNFIYSDTFGVTGSGSSNIVRQQCLSWFGNWMTMTLFCSNTLTNSGNDTFSISASSANYQITSEYSGLTDNGVSACAVDGSNSAAPATGTAGPITAGSITTTAAPDLLIASGWYNGAATASLTVPTSYTSRVSYIGQSNQTAHMLADQLPGATGTYSPTFALGTTPTGWMGIQAAFTTVPTSAATQIGGFLVGP